EHRQPLSATQPADEYRDQPARRADSLSAPRRAGAKPSLAGANRRADHSSVADRSSQREPQGAKLVLLGARPDARSSHGRGVAEAGQRPRDERAHGSVSFAGVDGGPATIAQAD